ncbi:MAG: T9SS type A sorting domain-containing protein [Chitinophagaceae bacterium]|nr:T9SS type A sorting domain-containing protein [Chitinophagaceae bacterium]
MKIKFLRNTILLNPAISRNIIRSVTGLVIFICWLPVSAQTVVTIGTTTSTSSTSGLSSSTTTGDRNERHMCIYSAAELTAAGITAGTNLLNIAWEKTGGALYYNKNLTIRVWLKHIAATTFPASPTFSTETGAATLVYQSTTDTIPAAPGWITFNFNTATPFFTWDGVQNLEVITELIRPTDWTETGFSWRTISSLTNAAANANAVSSAPPATLTRTGTRPQIRLGRPTPGNDAALVGMPNPVSAAAGVQNIDVSLRNTGANLLTSASISFTINGGAPVNFSWTGSLVPGGIATVTIGSNSFAGGPHTIVATAGNPNGGADADPTNNVFTKNIIICSPLSGAYTINQAAATGGTNFNNFNDFSSYLTSCGVSGNVTAIVTAGSGPYTEQVVFKNIPGIGAAATVTIQGSGETITSDTAIIQTGSNPNRHIIRLIDLQYFTINNLHVDMVTGSTAFIGIHVLSSGNHITISNCVVNMGTATSALIGGFVANSDPSGMLFPGGDFDFLSFTGNTTTMGAFGVSVNGMASPLATNVVINNNNFNDFNSNGVYLRETNGAVVSANQFDKSAGTISSVNAIQLAQSANINGRVFGNFIKMSQTSGSFVGIYLFNGTGHKVYNNLIYDIRSTSGDIEGIRVRTGATTPEIYFNTVSFDNTVATTGSLKAFREELSNTGSILRNNIFSVTQSTTGLKHAIELAVLTPPTAINSNNNVFWVSGGNIAYRPPSASFPTPLVFPTLASWQAASTQDAASFEVDPFFVSAVNPIPRSAVINNQAVTGTGITTDITGATRAVTPDPGAYEFSPPGNDAAITNFILPPIPHCATTLNVQFELTNAGGNTLNTVDINWTVNGVPQPVVNWTGPPLGPGLSTIVTLGTVPVTGSNIYNFSATSSNPNGGADTNPANDNFTYNGFRRGLAGALTINGAVAASATNFTSFQSAANTLSMHGICSAVTITVLNGPYNEQVVFNTIPGANAVNTVTLNGNNQILEYNPTVAASDHILQLNAVNYMIVENLRVNSLHPTQGRGIHITNGASKLVIRNNIVNVSLTNSTSSAFGIIISGANWLLDGSLSDSVVISGNTVSGGYSAIQLSGEHWTQPLTRISVLNNTVLDWYGFGVYLSYTNGCLVSKNIIRRPLRTNSGSDAVTPAGITVPAGSLSFLLEKNRIYDLHSSMPGTPTISRGVHMSGTTTAPTSGTIQNNLIYGMNNDGAQYGIQNNAVTGPVNIYHNTIVLNNATGASTSNTNAINLSNSTTQNGIDMRNNIFVVTRGGTGIKRIIDVSAASAPLTSNYNVAYLNAPGGTQTFAQVGSTTYNTLIDWQATGKDLNSVSQDPQFSNPGAGNFAPTNPLVDVSVMGTSPVGGITDDILNVVRSANPDAGAFEFVPPGCSTPVGGTANTASGPFCGSGSGTITATGYSTGVGISYQWQYSNDNFVTNINDLTGQTNPVTASTGTITSTTYYRLKVTCSTGPANAYSNIVSITITTAPSASIAYTGSPYCSNAGTATVTRTGTAGGTYSSTAGLTINTTTGAVTLGTSTPGTYTVSYTIAASGGCATFTTTTTITITALPAATISYAGNPYCSNAGTATVTRTGTAGGTYTAAPAGLIINAATGDVTLGTSTAGTYTVTYTTVSGSGCPVVTATAGITITALPAATISYAGSPYCSNAGTATVTRTGTAGGTYSSTAGLSINTTTGDVNLGTSTAGTYTVTYTVAAGGGCPVVTTTTAITISTASVAATTANASATSLCGPSTVTLSVSGGSLGTGATWRWYSGSCGGTAAGTGATLNVTVSTTTTYFVRAEGACNTTACASVTVSVIAQPSISIAASPRTTLLPGQTTTLTATVTPAAGYTITWYRNGVVVPGATGLTLIVSVSDLGTYTARATAGAGCTALSNTVTIIAESSGIVFVYPNPNRGQFQVRVYNQPGKQLTVLVHNALGQLVYNDRKITSAPYTRMDVDMRSAAAGTYIVSVINSDSEILGSKSIVIYR